MPKKTRQTAIKLCVDAHAQNLCSRGVLDRILQAVEGPIFVKDREHRWVYLNQAFERLTGFNPQGMLGKSDYDFFPKEQADIFWQTDELVFRTGKSDQNEEYITDARGLRHIILTTKSCFYDENGTPLLVGIIRDLTELRLAEEARRAAENRAQLALEGGGLGAWDWNVLTGQITLSDRWKSMLGYSVETNFEAEQIFAELLHPEDRDTLRETLWQHFEGEIPHFEAELRFLTRLGEYKWIYTRGQVLERQASGEVLRVCGTHLDIDARRRAEEGIRQYLQQLERAHRQIADQSTALMAARDRAEEASRAKSTFLANMSHEIRTPMNGIMGMLEILMQSDLNPLQREFSSLAKVSADSLLSILNDILDLSKIEAGKLAIHPKPFRLRELLGQIERITTAFAASKDLTLVVEVCPEVPDELLADYFRLRQILQNLLGNAVKFSNRCGGILLYVWASPTDVHGHLELHCSVADCGIGIPEDKLTLIFEAFTQADVGIAQKYGGTGLGLSICAELCQMMGGSIEVRSKIRVGSVFTAHIDCMLQARAEFAPGLKPTHELIHTPPLRVLVAENNPTSAKAVFGQLEQEGHSVTLLENATQALSACKTQQFDLVILAMDITAMDTQAMLEEIRKQPRHAKVPVVACTADATHDRARFLALGMIECLSKPIDMRELQNVIARVMSQAQGAGGELEPMPCR